MITKSNALLMFAGILLVSACQMEELGPELRKVQKKELIIEAACEMPGSGLRTGGKIEERKAALPKTCSGNAGRSMKYRKFSFCFGTRTLRFSLTFR